MLYEQMDLGKPKARQGYIVSPLCEKFVACHGVAYMPQMVSGQISATIIRLSSLGISITFYTQNLYLSERDLEEQVFYTPTH